MQCINLGPQNEFYDFVKGQVGLSSNSQATFLSHRVSLLCESKIV